MNAKGRKRCDDYVLLQRRAGDLVALEEAGMSWQELCSKMVKQNYLVQSAERRAEALEADNKRLQEAARGAEQTLERCDKHFQHGAAWVCSALCVLRAALAPQAGEQEEEREEAESLSIDSRAPREQKLE